MTITLPITFKDDAVREKMNSGELGAQEQQRFDEIVDLLESIDARLAQSQFPILSEDLIVHYVAYGTLDVNALQSILDVLISWDELKGKK